MSRLGMHLPPRIYHRSGFVLLDRIFWGRQNLCKRLRFGLRIPWRLVPVRFGVRKVLIRQVRSEDLGGIEVHGSREKIEGEVSECENVSDRRPHS